MAPTPFAAALIKKLSVSNTIDADDRQALEELPITGRFYDPQQTIVHEYDRPSHCCLVVDGFVIRSKSAEGQRQILSIHISGEIPDLQSLHLHVMDHELSTLTGCTLGFIAHDVLRQLCVARPNLAAALWRETLVDAAIFREWIVNVGRRSSVARMAHLIVEMWERLDHIGRTRDGAFEFPVTQVELADCLGLTPVHVNRVLQQLRQDKLLHLARKECNILEKGRLEELGQFEPTYLHLSPQL